MNAIRKIFAIVLLLVLVAVPAQAAYPEKAVRLIVPYPPGGLGDRTMRVIGERLSRRLGQPVLIENKAGGGQILAAQAAAAAAPDGYTLLVGSITMLSLNQVTVKNLPYDPRRAFEPISRLFDFPFFLVVNKDVPADSVAGLIALAKSKPGGLTVGSIGTGSSQHLAGEMFSQAAGVKFLHVPYKGSAEANTDLLAGRIDLMFDPGVTVLPHAQTGRLKLLAITTAKRAAEHPNTPTLIESGLPGVEFTSWLGLLAPAGTPKPVLERLSSDMTQILNAPDLQQQFVKEGIKFHSSTPAEFASFIESETIRFRKLVKDSGISLD